MEYPVLQERARFELACRLKVLGQDVAAWTEPTRADERGLSASQRTALAEMMRVLEARQQGAFEAINGAPSSSFLSID